MYVRHIKLHNFRSWNSLELHLSPGSTIICAPNGYGKTNIIEALLYSSIFESHRVSTDKPLVKNGNNQAIISTIVVNDDRELEISIEISSEKTNRFQLNKNPIKNSREIYGILKTVLFSPEDLLLIRGDPGVRRKYLDELISIRRPRMSLVKAEYNRVIRQRTALLKNLSSSSFQDELALPTLEVWDQHLIQYGAEIILSRIEITKLLTPYIQHSYHALSSDERPITIQYYTNNIFIDISQETPTMNTIQELLMNNLIQQRKNEIRRGICLVGPHRDDLHLSLGDNPFKGFASHGECWSMALALKLACYQLLTEEGPEPVLLLDDVFAELDRKRSSALIQEISNAEQTIVTEAVLNSVSDNWAQNKVYIDLIIDNNDRYSCVKDNFYEQ